MGTLVDGLSTRSPEEWQQVPRFFGKPLKPPRVKEGGGFSTGHRYFFDTISIFIIFINKHSIFINIHQYSSIFII